MRLVSGLYQACGGGKKSENQLKNEAAEAYRKNQERLQRESQIRMDRKTAERLEKEERKEKERRDKERRKRGGRVVFNFQQVSQSEVNERVSRAGVVLCSLNL